ncbi:hypothetical protein G7Y89_g12971 [Cudoniella acicularis]|uniref:Uncharacterized protein n=1 Tax=Cudoniella acicularis TaxID=354080 RepID=A0A8H4VWV5_9HELO|nr:hypothetical protein G7Y89_g12971 [Cudoniella acicularis]
MSSLHHLGPIGMLHRQFSSPTSPRFSHYAPREDLTEDNKDVLIERLNDLVARLSKDNSLENSAVTAIHHKVDEIEVLMRGEENHRKSVNLAIESTSELIEDDTFSWGPRTPTRTIRMRLPGTSRHSARSSTAESVITPAKAAKIAVEAETLASQLSKAVAELQLRREESDHIHDMLVTRAEKAAERILLLEYRIAEMEDDFDANQSELKFLRIQLQAIEAQCSEYIPRNGDMELSESIMNWKIDWEDIDRKSKARRENHWLSKANFRISYSIDAGDRFARPLALSHRAVLVFTRTEHTLVKRDGLRLLALNVAFDYRRAFIIKELDIRQNGADAPDCVQVPDYVSEFFEPSSADRVGFVYGENIYGYRWENTGDQCLDTIMTYNWQFLLPITSALLSKTIPCEFHWSQSTRLAQILRPIPALAFQSIQNLPKPLTPFNPHKAGTGVTYGMVALLICGALLFLSQRRKQRAQRDGNANNTRYDKPVLYGKAAEKQMFEISGHDKPKLEAQGSGQGMELLEQVKFKQRSLQASPSAGMCLGFSPKIETVDSCRFENLPPAPLLFYSSATQHFSKACQHATHLWIEPVGHRTSNAARVDNAVKKIQAAIPQANISGFTVDVSQDDVEAGLEKLFADVTKAIGRPLDHIVYTAVRLDFRLLQNVTIEFLRSDAQFLFNVPILIAKIAPKHMKQSHTSSITFTSGQIAEKPYKGLAVASGWGAALIGLTRSFALDLAPIRVSLVSPGTTDTETQGPEEVRAKRMAEVAKTALLDKVGTPEEVGEAYIYLMKDNNNTGSVVISSGGSLLKWKVEKGDWRGSLPVTIGRAWARKSVNYSKAGK